MLRGGIAGIALAVLAGCAVPERVPEAVSLPQVSRFSANDPGEGVPAGWRPWTLAKFKKPTQYRLTSYDGRTVIKASADSSASGLVHAVAIDPRLYPLLEWRWKVTDLIERADNTKKHTEDSPVRLVVSFEGDLERLSFSDRMFFDNVRVFTGQELPYATLMYIWENRARKGSVIPNLHTSRIKMVVAESGREKLGNWQDVTRNVYEDYRRAFGEEPGRISSIAIMTDTDNTGGNIHAYYGDIQFRRILAPRVGHRSE